jgi:predicted nucleic acid-binding protein
MLYIDSSALLKLFWDEPESAEVDRRLSTEDVVVVSSLAELEAEVQFAAGRFAGRYGEPQRRRLRAQLTGLRSTEPFRFRPVPGAIFEMALRQLEAGRRHCRTLDRLHLAAMAELEVTRLMTLDVAQGAAARELGFEVVMPGRTGDRHG